MVGSDPELADVCLEGDEQVEDEHCFFWMESDGQVLVSNEALNHVILVNGEETFDQLLAHGDTIQIGTSTFIYYESDGEPAPAPAASPLRFDSNPNLYETGGGEYQTLMDYVFDWTAVERAAILLLGPSGDELVVGTYAQAVDDDSARFSMNRSIVELAVTDRIPILRNDTESVICIPLIAAGTVAGVIYIQHSERNALDNSTLRELVEKAKDAAEALDRPIHVDWQQNGNRRPEHVIPVTHDLVGDSSEMHELFWRIGKVGPMDSTTLIQGATGTGKELVARAIHQNSHRAKNAFVTVNCGAISPSLLESELFGHEKGAFTNALTQKKGLIESADGGTLFFDEIGELPLSAQVALLRVLQESEVVRVGSTRPIQVNVRIIAATHRDLAQMAAEGRFREDLFYRLKVYSINVPPLSARRGDIPGLVSHFLRRLSHVRKVKGLERETRRVFTSYAWPGNVRQLENAIHYALVEGTTDWIRLKDLPPEFRAAKLEGTARRPTMKERLDAAREQAGLDELQRCNGNHAEAAKVLDINPNYLRELIRQFKRKRKAM